MKKFLYPLAVGWLALISCHKFLDKQYDGSLKIPTTIADMQAILDQVGVMNGMSSDQLGVVPALGEAACDDYYLLGSAYAKTNDCNDAVPVLQHGLTLAVSADSPTYQPVNFQDILNTCGVAQSLPPAATADSSGNPTATPVPAK